MVEMAALSRRGHPAGMAELADALVLGASAQKACRFKSCSRHQNYSCFLATISAVALSFTTSRSHST